MTTNIREKTDRERTGRFICIIAVLAVSAVVALAACGKAATAPRTHPAPRAVASSVAAKAKAYAHTPQFQAAVASVRAKGQKCVKSAGSVRAVVECDAPKQDLVAALKCVWRKVRASIFHPVKAAEADAPTCVVLAEHGQVKVAHKK